MNSFIFSKQAPMFWVSFRETIANKLIASNFKTLHMLCRIFTSYEGWIPVCLPQVTIVKPMMHWASFAQIKKRSDVLLRRSSTFWWCCRQVRADRGGLWCPYVMTGYSAHQCFIKLHTFLVGTTSCMLNLNIQPLRPVKSKAWWWHT
jgi:hypothetical protein